MKIKVKFKVLGKLFLEKKNRQTKNNNNKKNKTTKQKQKHNKQQKQTATLKLKRIYQYIKSFYLFTAISQLLSTIFFLIAYTLAYCLQSVESCTKCSYLSNGVGLK